MRHCFGDRGSSDVSCEGTKVDGVDGFIVVVIGATDTTGDGVLAVADGGYAGDGGGVGVEGGQEVGGGVRVIEVEGVETGVGEGGNEHSVGDRVDSAIFNVGGGAEVEELGDGYG